MVYIGVSTDSLEDRKRDHNQRVNKPYASIFHNAISTYGEDAFEWETIDTAYSIDELAQKEKSYIFEYNALENGYNADSGGGFKKTVYKYDIETGKLLETFECLDDAGATVEASKQQISKACLNVNNTYAGFYWSYEKHDIFEPNVDLRRKRVRQYTLDGYLLAEFKSIAEASRITGVNNSSIAKVCRGDRKTAGGFYFEFC